MYECVYVRVYLLTEPKHRKHSHTQRAREKLIYDIHICLPCTAAVVVIVSVSSSASVSLFSCFIDTCVLQFFGSAHYRSSCLKSPKTSSVGRVDYWKMWVGNKLISVLLVFICISNTSLDYINTLYTTVVDALLWLLPLSLLLSSLSIVIELAIVGC